MTIYRDWEPSPPYSHVVGLIVADSTKASEVVVVVPSMYYSDYICIMNPPDIRIPNLGAYAKYDRDRGGESRISTHDGQEEE